jgi:hypothetical protein
MVGYGVQGQRQVHVKLARAQTIDDEGGARCRKTSDEPDRSGVLEAVDFGRYGRGDAIGVVVGVVGAGRVSRGLHRTERERPVAH